MAEELVEEAQEGLDHRKKFDRAQAYILLEDQYIEPKKPSHEFFASFMQRLRYAEAKDIPIAAVCFHPDSPVGEILFNVDNTLGLPLVGFAAITLHEILHVCKDHVYYEEAFKDPKFFNIMADIEVNHETETVLGYPLPHNMILQDHWKKYTADGKGTVVLMSAKVVADMFKVDPPMRTEETMENGRKVTREVVDETQVAIWYYRYFKEKIAERQKQTGNQLLPCPAKCTSGQQGKPNGNNPSASDPNGTPDAGSGQQPGGDGVRKPGDQPTDVGTPGDSPVAGADGTPDSPGQGAGGQDQAQAGSPGDQPGGPDVGDQGEPQQDSQHGGQPGDPAGGSQAGEQGDQVDGASGNSPAGAGTGSGGGGLGNVDPGALGGTPGQSGQDTSGGNPSGHGNHRDQRGPGSGHAGSQANTNPTGDPGADTGTDTHQGDHHLNDQVKPGSGSKASADPCPCCGGAGEASVDQVAEYLNDLTGHQAWKKMQEQPSDLRELTRRYAAELFDEIVKDTPGGCPGFLSADHANAVKVLKRPDIDWLSKLDEFHGGAGSLMPSINRRRFNKKDLLGRASFKPDQRIGEVIDVSGSVPNAAYGAFMGANLAIMERNESEVYVIEIDTEIKAQYLLNDVGVKDEYVRHGAGGTILTKAFEELNRLTEEDGMDFGGCIVYTDGDLFDWPDPRIVHPNTLWVVTRKENLGVPEKLGMPGESVWMDVSKFK